MAEIVLIAPDYERMAEKVFHDHPDIQWIRHAHIRIGFLASDKEKKSKGRAVYGECIRVKEVYQPYCHKDFLIVIYEPNVELFAYEQLEILLYHELLHIGMDDSGKEVRYIVNPHDVEDFRAIIDRYGIDWAEQ